MACPTNEFVDPRVRRTRKLLHDALHALMREKHYAQISVQDITERAMVNRATFYAHYQDKQALLEQVLITDFQAFLGARFPECPTYNAESLEAIALGVIEFMGGLAGGCAEAAKEMGHVIEAALQQELYDLFRHWVGPEPQAPFKGHHPDTVATMLAWSLFGTAYRWTHGNRKRTPEAVAKAMVALVFPPLGPPLSREAPELANPRS